MPAPPVLPVLQPQQQLPQQSQQQQQSNVEAVRAGMRRTRSLSPSSSSGSDSDEGGLSTTKRRRTAGTKASRARARKNESQDELAERRERNRVAAANSRARKKLYIANLEDRAAALEQQNAALSARLSALEQQAAESQQLRRENQELRMRVQALEQQHHLETNIVQQAAAGRASPINKSAELEIVNSQQLEWLARLISALLCTLVSRALCLRPDSSCFPVSLKQQKQQQQQPQQQQQQQQQQLKQEDRPIPLQLADIPWRRLMKSPRSPNSTWTTSTQFSARALKLTSSANWALPAASSRRVTVETTTSCPPSSELPAQSNKNVTPLLALLLTRAVTLSVSQHIQKHRARSAVSK
ncbi:MAG: hypothetical protein MHM6MM_003085 [Cercozoa sp. M6MM]